MSNFVPIALVVDVLAVLGIHGGVERASVNGRDWRTLIEQDLHPDPRLTRLEHCELRVLEEALICSRVGGMTKWMTFWGA